MHQKVDAKKYSDNYDRIFGKKELPGKDDNDENTDSVDSVDDSTDDDTGTAN
jgi:hypothetical protein